MRELTGTDRADAMFVDALHYTDGSGGARRFLLDPDLGEHRVGRSDQCHLVLPWDKEVSRVHLLLVPQRDFWLFADEGMSRNGTFVNSSPIAERRYRLRHEDRVRVGSTVLTFRCGRPQLVDDAGTRDAGRRHTLSFEQQQTLIALCRPLLSRMSALPATNAQMASELGVSEEGVKSRLQTLYTVFGLNEARQGEKRFLLAQRAAAEGYAALGASR